MDAIASYFKFAERGTSLSTEVRAGVTTFAVMAYIIFLNPLILGVTNADGVLVGPDPVAVGAGTAFMTASRRPARTSRVMTRPSMTMTPIAPC
ncbi:MAG: transporter, partial [Chloroflexi bacterium]|nr:transporter [Chloroflexota bacterium]